MKILGRIVIGLALFAATYLVFSDAISFWMGTGSSRIERLDLGKFTFVRDGQLRLGGPGVHLKEVKFYRTPDGKEAAFFEAITGDSQGLFLGGSHKIFNDVGFSEVTTYERFVVSTYVLKRTAVLLVCFFIILAVAGMCLHLLGDGQGVSKRDGKTIEG